MRANRFNEASLASGQPNGLLQAAFVHMMATNDSGGARVGGEAVGGEDILPAPFAIGIGVFSFQGEGQVDGPITFFEVGSMELFHPRQMRLEGFNELVGQDRYPIFHPFAFADEDLMLGEVQIFDSQADTFHQTQTASVEEFGHQLRVAGHLTNDSVDFVPSTSSGQALVRTTGRRSGFLARTISSASSKSWCNTSRYRNKTALRA